MFRTGWELHCFHFILNLNFLAIAIHFFICTHLSYEEGIDGTGFTCCFLPFLLRMFMLHSFFEAALYRSCIQRLFRFGVVQDTERVARPISEAVKQEASCTYGALCSYMRSLLLANCVDGNEVERRSIVSSHAASVAASRAASGLCRKNDEMLERPTLMQSDQDLHHRKLRIRLCACAGRCAQKALPLHTRVNR